MACDKLVFSALYTRKFFVHPDHSKWLLEGFYRRKKNNFVRDRVLAAPNPPFSHIRDRCRH